jgi:glycosyltransferase involved in cell wall biosynthesis
MSSVEIDEKNSYELLDRIYSEIEKLSEEEIMKKNYIEDETLKREIHDLVNSKTKSFRYAILTQVLAKVVNPMANCLVLQLKAKEKGICGAFDARSFCRKVVVKFEEDRLDGALGSAPDPYVSKPLRHEMVTLNILNEIKDKEGWERLYRVLDLIQKSTDHQFLNNVLKQILLEIRKRQLRFKKAVVRSVKADVSPYKLIRVVEEFLSKPSSGIRSQTIVYALVKTINEKIKAFNRVTTSKATAANYFTHRFADIECVNESGNLKLAISVTDRLTKEKLIEELNKAVNRNIKHLLIIAFEIAMHISDINALVNRYMKEYSIFVKVESLTEFVIFMMTLLNNELRLKFLNKVSETLNEFKYYDHLQDWNKLLQNIIGIKS